MKKRLSTLTLIVALVWSISASACSLGPSKPASTLESVSLQLQWVPQSQFAGYYVALDKGWYRDEGLDMTIRPGGPNVVTFDAVVAGTADFGTAFLADLIADVEKGQPVISIAQIQQMNGLLLIAKKTSGIRRPADLVGKRIGIWGSSWQAQLDALLARERISKEDVEIVSQGADMQQFLNGDLDVASAMVYNEYHQVLESGLSVQDLNVIDYVLYGLGLPGDTLFTSRRLVQENPDLCLRMLRASLRGWQYAIDNPKEAVAIVLKYDGSGKAARDHQLSMMREISLLVDVRWRQIGYTDQTTVQQTVKTLLRYNVLQAAPGPDDIFTNTFWQQAQTSQ